MLGSIVSPEKIAEIRATHKLHHTAWYKGYQSRKCESADVYNGRFGKGYVIYTSVKRSSTYCYITYYIE